MLKFLGSPELLFQRGAVVLNLKECEIGSPQKKFGMGYVKMHGFHGNPLYDSREWGVCLKIQSYLGFFIS